MIITFFFFFLNTLCYNIDCCHSAGNRRVCVNAAVGGGGAGLRFIPRDAMSEDALETSFLKRIASAFKGEIRLETTRER